MIQILDKYGNTSTDDGRVIILDKFGDVKKPAVSSGTVTSILTASPITGGTITTTGTIGITQSTTSTDGYLSSTDWNTFNGKQNALSGTINTITYWDSATTIASLPLTTYPSLTELSYSKGVTSSIQTQINSKGTFTLPSLTSGSVLFSNGTTIAQDNANFFWDDTNNRLGIGTASPTVPFDLRGNQLITFADVANRDLGPFSFNISNGTFSKFNLVHDVSASRLNIMGTSTQGVRIDAGSNSTISALGGAGLTISAPSNNLNMSCINFLLNTNGSERMRLNSSGNLLINTTTDNGGKLQIKAGGALSTDIALKIRDSVEAVDLFTVGGTGVATIKSNTFTGTMSFAQTGNSTSKISGGPSTENITFGPSNRIFLNAAEIVANGNLSLLGNNISANNAAGNLINNTSLIQNNGLRNGIIFQTNAWQNNGAGGSSTLNAVSISPNVNMTLGSTTGVVLLLNPTLNTTGGTNTVRGIYYNPTLTSLTGTSHIAIETVTGDVILGSTSGNVGIGTASPTAKLQIELADNGISTIFKSLGGQIRLRGYLSANYGAVIESFNPAATLNERLTLSGSKIQLLDGNVLVNTFTDNGGKLQIKAGGALSTDIALRVRNSTDNGDLMLVNGLGNVGIGTPILSSKFNLNGNFEFQGIAGTNRYIATNEDSTGTGRLVIQAGGGSASFGGSLLLYANAHATYPANVVVGLSQNTSAKFRVNSGSLDGGADFFVVSYANGNAGIGTSNPVASAKLDITSTTQGFLPPRMTNAQRIAIATPAVGLCVYCTDTVEGVYVNKSTGWTFIG